MIASRMKTIPAAKALVRVMRAPSQVACQAEAER